MKVLILSVGGSCEPVVNAIKEYRPNYVYFVCSGGPRGSERAVDGPGDPCGDTRKVRCQKCQADVPLGNPRGKAIVLQADLKAGVYEKICLEDPDDLDECYMKLSQLASSLPDKHPGNLEVIANFTGGTKTMSVALAMVGTMTERWDLSLNKGARLDLIKVASGTDVPIVVDKWRVFAHRQLEGVRDCLRRYDYAAADEVLSQLSAHPLGKDLLSKVIRVRQVAKAFDLWDRFDHKHALLLLQAVGGEFLVPYIRSAAMMLGRPGSTTGYECVVDLLLNAERRAEQRRYDDAVGRIYCALELIAQVRLKKKHQLETGSLTVEQLPRTLRDGYCGKADEQGRLLLGLTGVHELLHKLGDPIGAVYDAQKSRILDALKIRNTSILAHGLTPVGEDGYRKVSSALGLAIQNMSGAVGVRLEPMQLPRDEILVAVDRTSRQGLGKAGHRERSTTPV